MTRGRSRLWDLLRRIAWEAREGRGMLYTIVLEDRLAPGGARRVRGDRIRRLTPWGALELDDGSVIPSHRVRVIMREGRVIYPDEER